MAQPNVEECIRQLESRGFSQIVPKGGRGFDATGVAEFTAVLRGEKVAVRALAVMPGGRVPNFLQSVKLCALDHPHIVQPRALIGAPPYVFVVTEHANGGDLFSLVGRAPGTRGLPGPAARYVFQQLMLALDFCRRQGIVIRNLDPRTLLLFWNNKGMPIVKLSDLTLAKDTAMQGPAQTPVVASVWTCPQMVRQATAQDSSWEDLAPVCDVWSAMAILYHLLTGELPFSKHEVSAWPSTPVAKWRFNEEALHREGLQGVGMDGIREMMRQVFTGGNLSAAEYAQAGRPSVQDVMQEAWVATDLPPETAETQELHMDKTEALQQMIRDKLAPALEAAAQLRGVFHVVETVSPMMSRSPGDVDEGPFANGPASQSGRAANETLPRSSSADSIVSSYEVQVHQGEPTPPAAGGGDVIRAFWDFVNINERRGGGAR